MQTIHELQKAYSIFFDSSTPFASIQKQQGATESWGSSLVTGDWLPIWRVKGKKSLLVSWAFRCTANTEGKPITAPTS